MDTSSATTQAFVVLVEMQIEPQHYEDFMALMKRNAANSRDGEDGCLIFDVCIPDTAQDPPTVLLYERYVSAEAFELHLRTAHFKVFDEGSRHMIRAKSVRRYWLQAN
ncbi:MAG: putative quinol monooxygenase [Lautropia sp.]|nr:putative quinol monooxygenase [Lautropia sp.]